VSNESEKQYEDDRERLLEEIRRRAEEAELKRLEEEELAQRRDTEPPPSKEEEEHLEEEEQTQGWDVELPRPVEEPFRAPEVPPRPFEEPPAPPKAPSRPDQESFAPPEVPPPVPVPAAQAPVHPEEPEIEPHELLEEARRLYEHERYAKALELVNKVLDVFPGLGEATKLHDEIQRASDLADVVRMEEARHREKHLQPLPPAPPPPPVASTTRSESDFWGPTQPDVPSDGFPPEVQEVRPVKAPPPVIDRAAARLARVKPRVKIPVKPILIGSALLVTAIVAYIIIDSLISAVAPPQQVLLVIPAAPASAEESGQLTADGLTASLIQTIGRAPEVRVIAPVSAFNSRTTSVRPQLLAKNLRAGFVLTWNIQQVGEMLMCNAALMDTVDDGPIWKVSFESSMADLPSRRIAFAREIVEAMDVNLPSENDPLAPGSQPGGIRSYGLYLQAIALARSSAPNALARAKELLQLVVQTDSVWGEGWSALAWVSMLETERNPDAPPSEAVTALTNIQKAITRGARVAETFRVWGMIETINANYPKAVERYRTAVDLCPGDADAQQRLALMLMLRGSKEEALKAVSAAAQWDPLNAEVLTVRGLIQQFNGDVRGAEQSYARARQVSRDQFEPAADLHMDILISLQRADDALSAATDMAARRRDDPLSHYRLGRIAQIAGRPIPEWQNMFRQTLGLIEQQLRLRPDDPAMLALQALTYTRLGQRKDALDANARALRVAPKNLEVLYGTARMYALQRDQKQAAAYLAQAVDRRYDLYRIIDMDFYNVRSDQDFLTAITR